MKFNVKNYLSFFLFFYCVTGFAQNKQDLEMFIKEAYSKHTVKGIQVNIIQDDKTILNLSEGSHLNHDLTVDQPLFIGSVSKVITGLAIAVLSEQGKLDINDKVKKYIKSFDEPKFSKLTIKHLLHHYSGFSQKSGYASEVEYQGRFELAEMNLPPGTKGQYSSTNFSILGKIIEIVSQKSYAVFIENEIFKPLKMSHSKIPLPERGSTIEGYTSFFGIQIPSKQMTYEKLIVPAGYIISTAEDINNMNRMFLSKGVIENKRFLSRQTIKEIFTPFNNTTNGYGMSWGIGSLNGEKMYSHEGLTKISNAFTAIFPDRNMAVTVIANSNSGPFSSVSQKIVEGVIDITNDKKANTFPIGLIIRIIFGILALKTLFDAIRSSLKWKKIIWVRPSKVRFQYVFSLIMDLIPLAVLIFIPVVFNVPISMFMRILPDLGIALILGGVLAIPIGIINFMYKCNREIEVVVINNN